MKKRSMSNTAGAIHARDHQEMPRLPFLGGAVATTRSLTAVAIDYLLVKISEYNSVLGKLGKLLPLTRKAQLIFCINYTITIAFHCLPDEYSRERVKKAVHDPVGAGVDERRGEGLYGRPHQGLLRHPLVHYDRPYRYLTRATRAAIKAPTPLHAT